jgi:hypothetical protein
MRQISARGGLPGIFLSRGTLDWLCGQGREGIAPVQLPRAAPSTLPSLLFEQHYATKFTRKWF